MNGNIYINIDFISLNNEDCRIECKHISSFDEYDDEVVFETDVPIENIKRGWVGDMFCHLSGCKILDMRHKVTSSKCIFNVLLAKITICSAPDTCIRWKYTFLKD